MSELFSEIRRINRGAPKIPDYDPQAGVGPNEPGPGSPNWIKKYGPQTLEEQAMTTAINVEAAESSKFRKILDCIGIPRPK